MRPQDYRWMSLKDVLRYEPEMQRLGVSKVARSPRGFLTAYKQGRTAAVTKRMMVPDHPQTWAERRNHSSRGTLHNIGRTRHTAAG